MTVKIGGKTYKGKYKGPDKYKGDPKKLAVHNAAKRLTAKKKPAAKPTSKTTLASNAVNKAATKYPATAAAPTTPGAPTVPNPGAVGSNSSGNIQLQSNLEIEQQVIDAAEYVREQNEQATQLDTQALISEALGQKNSRDAYQEQRGQTNANMAYRGMKGSAALNANAKDRGNFQKMMAEVAAQKTQQTTQAGNMRTAAGNWNLAEQGKINLARQAYTDEQSKLNPTTGSSPIESGLKANTAPTTPAAPAAAKAAPKAAVKAVVKKVTPKKTYKGKYPGPDKYKGNKSLIAAAKRKAGKK